jgi:drug/metabolite transporter (DMT)-like permease
MMARDAKTTAYVALVAVCFFWGTTYLGIRAALESFPPAVLVSTRFAISGGILLLAAWWRGSHIPRGRELWTTAFSGVVILGFGNSALAWAEQLIPSGLASLFVTITPFWFVIFEAMLPGGVPMHAPTIVGMVIGFIGTAMLFLPGSGAWNPATVAGFAILQGGCITWCLGSIYQKRQPVKAHPIVTGAIQQLASAIVFVPLAVWLPHPPIVLHARAVWAVVYLIIFGSIVGYSAYAYAISRLPVAIVSIYPYINAVVAVSLGWLFYRERFGWNEFGAMLVIFLGVGIVKWQNSAH